MWDNPKLLNSISNALFGCALLLVLWGGMKLVVESPLFLLRTIRVEGELKHVTRADVVDALQGKLAGTFFSMDIEAVRALFETIPWVRRAEVRRLWPDRLEVRMEEHMPLARWGQPEDGRLVNSFGEVFNIGQSDDVHDLPGNGKPELPQFSGPIGTSVDVMRNYVLFRDMLAPIQLHPRAEVLSPRYGWQLRLSNGMTMQLGRNSEKERIADRLARFVLVYPKTLAPLSRRLDYVDLRYANGLALRVPGMSDTGKPVMAPARLPERRKRTA